jgi:hypothetical protein
MPAYHYYGALWNKKCQNPNCGKDLWHTRYRGDAKTCSDKCRKALSRKNKRSQIAPANRDTSRKGVTNGL